MEFRVLGSIEVAGALRTPTPPGGKERAVLARLLLDPGRSVPVDALLDAVWDDAPRDAAARSLSVRIARLRGFLEPGRASGDPARVLVREPGGYRLAIHPEQVDAARFEAQVAAAGALAPAERLDALDAALALWRGPAYADVADLEFARPEIRRLDALRSGAEETRARCLVDLGREQEAIPELERLLARDPLREELARTLMLALYRAGRQVDALAAYRELAARLGELGLQPVGGTRELEHAILTQDPRLTRAPSARAARPPGRPAATRCSPRCTPSWARRWAATAGSCSSAARRARASPWRSTASWPRRPPASGSWSASGSASSTAAPASRTCRSWTRSARSVAARRPTVTRWWPRCSSARPPGSPSCRG